MAKKDLKEATKAATAGMFTSKAQPDRTKPTEPQKDSMVAEKEDDATVVKKKKPASQRTKKKANDYLYLDLRPAGGADLKSYVMEQAHRTSMEQGRNVSATNYIQNLIKRDMDSEEGNTTRAKIISMLDNATDEKLETICTIIKNII